MRDLMMILPYQTLTEPNVRTIQRCLPLGLPPRRNLHCRNIVVDVLVGLGLVVAAVLGGQRLLCIVSMSSRLVLVSR